MNSFPTLVALFLIPVFIFLLTRRRPSQKLPPGSLGLPIVGQNLSFLWAMRANTLENWLENRVRKYGPISKLNLFGIPTVLICGKAANKFVFTADSRTITNNQPGAAKVILGDQNLMQLTGKDHKRVRNALVSFLKPDSLKQYVGKIEGEVKRHLEMHWEGKHKVTVFPLMKMLTFDIICSLIFGIERGARRDELVKCLQCMVEGMLSIPINFPFTRYNQSLRATARVQNIVKQLMREKRVELEQKGTSSHQDLITYLLSIYGDNEQEAVSEDEVVHNIVLILIAGYETSSILITFIVRLLANNRSILAGVAQEQEDIAKNKSSRELLTWEDLAKMKYTWRVAMETLRLIPPLFGGLKKTLKDVEFGGYLIPQGWQILWTASMTHMDANIFQDPSKFDPARFEDQASIPPYCFLAFGAGQRFCPGYEFARIETLVTIHYLVTRFTWKLCSTNDSFKRDPMPVPYQGLPIQIFPKKLS